MPQGLDCTTSCRTEAEDKSEAGGESEGVRCAGDAKLHQITLYHRSSKCHCTLSLLAQNMGMSRFQVSMLVNIPVNLCVVDIAAA